MFLEMLQPFAISLLIGLGVGIERERKTQEGKGTLGVRTFALVALSGTVAGQIRSSALTAGLSLVLAALLATGYLRAAKLANSKDIDVGLTTEIAASLVFAVGYLACAERLLAGVLGVVIVTILYSRRFLHLFSREFLRPADIAATLFLAILAFIVIPVMPDRAIDPWNLVNPRNMAQIMLLIAGVEFGGYMVERLAGPKIGSLATGFFGGLASSTTVFVTVSRMARADGKRTWTAISAGLAAVVATLILFVAIVIAASPVLFVSVALPALASALMAGIGAYFASRKAAGFALNGTDEASPLDISGILKLSAFVFGLLALAAVVKAQFGAEGVRIVAFVSGLFELHATALAAARLHQIANLTEVEATQTLLLAALASVISKLGICWTIGFGRFAVLMSIALTCIIAAGLACHFAVVTLVH
ncbi:MAG: MgtC/SapB family protein [Proteobacteria bacterium]|nr:MgtC/SapB family protein [Pseudomonadota bacterium]